MQSDLRPGRVGGIHARQVVYLLQPLKPPCRIGGWFPVELFDPAGRPERYRAVVDAIVVTDFLLHGLAGSDPYGNKFFF